MSTRHTPSRYQPNTSVKQRHSSGMPTEQQLKTSFNTKASHTKASKQSNSPLYRNKQTHANRLHYPPHNPKTRTHTLPTQTAYTPHPPVQPSIPHSNSLSSPASQPTKQPPQNQRRSVGKRITSSGKRLHPFLTDPQPTTSAIRIHAGCSVGKRCTGMADALLRPPTEEGGVLFRAYRGVGGGRHGEITWVGGWVGCMDG
ncbi:hypothetical protein M3J09_013583 [Ascochyta lentis]